MTSCPTSSSCTAEITFTGSGLAVTPTPRTTYAFVLFVSFSHSYLFLQAGEGTPSTDRSNVVQLSSLEASYPASDSWLKDNDALFEGSTLRNRMAHLDQTGCLTQQQLLDANNNNAGNAKKDKRNCMKLNAAPTPYFDGGLVQMNKTGTFYYMSSRNNNFSNRGQKSILIVAPTLPAWAIAMVVIGSVVFVGSAGMAGAMFYAKSHPASQVASYLTRIQGRI